MKKGLLSSAIAMCVATGNTFAGDADIFVFLENNPLQGVEVSLNGEVIGTTNQGGETNTVIDKGGDHTVTLHQQGLQLALSSFELEEDQDAEVSMVLSEDKPPKVNVYKSGGDVTKSMGMLKGQVKNSDGESLANVEISVLGTDILVVSDENGEFQTDIPRGRYELTIDHPDYASRTVEGIRIIANVGTAAIITLQTQEAVASGAPVEETLVLGRFIANENDAFTIEQMSTAVVDAIDMEQLARAGDSNIASALKRIVGISITDGKYAVVRGLDGRYISATANRNLMPTTNPFKRDVELDAIPSDILGGIEIQKSFSADLPADSTAGSIKVNTRGMPTEYINKLSFSFGQNTGIAGEDVLTHESGSDAFWGFGTDYRELPDATGEIASGEGGFSVCQIEGQQRCVQADDASFAATRLRNEWVPTTESASPNYSISYTLGGTQDYSAGALGVYSSLSFDKSYKSKIDAELSDPLNDSGAYSEDSLSTSLNGYLVTGFEFNNGSDFESKTFVLRNSNQKTRFFDGVDDEDDQLSKTVLEWVERQFVAQQFSGEFVIDDVQSLEWRLAGSRTNTDIPDRRSYVFFGDFLPFSDLERMWGELEEDATDFGLDYTNSFEYGADAFTDIKVGVLYNSKDRTNEIVRLGLASPRISLEGNIETLLDPQSFFDDDLRLKVNTTESDTYEASRETTAAYLATETVYGDAWTFVAGVRAEQSDLNVLLPNVSAGENEVEKNSDDLYPSLAVVYRPADAWQFRFGASETISRPTLTEVSPSCYYGEQNREFCGNSDLFDSDISNLDLRADFYFGDEGNFSVALFHKDISNPVELGAADASGSASDAYTWRNEEHATIQGVEFDLFTPFLSKGEHSAFVGANISFIDSEVELEADSERLQKLETRELQGQSPKLANIQLGYDHLGTGQKLTFLLNYFDDRIDIATKATPLIYEKGRATLDLNYELPFMDEAATFKVKIKNLSDQKVEYTQFDRTIETWKNGTQVSMGLSYKF